MINRIQCGDMAPWWEQGAHKFVFDPVRSRYIVLGFYATAVDDIGQAALQALQKNHRLVDNGKVCFFGISNDPKDESERRVNEAFSSIQFLWDFGGAVNRAYGVGSSRVWIILNPMLRVVCILPYRADGSDREQLIETLDGLPPPSEFLGFEMPAPILILSDVFETELCRHLISLFDQYGGRESGFMQEVDGKAVEAYDDNWKRRKDYTITDAGLIQGLRTRIGRRVVPEIWKAYHYKATRIERDLVACYTAEDGGFFGPHRDDTVRSTAHRRFAVSINLNDDFEGGEVSFPEYSPRGFKAPIGAAVVFSCSLIHSVAKITRGRRYAFLPFLHDEEAEKIRSDNVSRNVD
jgi:predicted 2-oxoglutarate/Fe(II)-dependent dioxygenase YbiX/peroxiredoxin